MSNFFCCHNVFNSVKNDLFMKNIFSIFVPRCFSKSSTADMLYVGKVFKLFSELKFIVLISDVLCGSQHHWISYTPDISSWSLFQHTKNLQQVTLIISRQKYIENLYKWFCNHWIQLKNCGNRWKAISSFATIILKVVCCRFLYVVKGIISIFYFYHNCTFISKDFPYFCLDIFLYIVFCCRFVVCAES